MTSYAELHARSAYSFLTGANQPAELVERAVELELSALGLTDNDGLYGAVQHTRAASQMGLAAVVGSEIRHRSVSGEISQIVALCTSASDYALLSRTLAAAHLAAGDGSGGTSRPPLCDLPALGPGELFILTGAPGRGEVARLLAAGEMAAARREIAALVDLFGRERIGVEIVARQDPTDTALHDGLATLAEEFGLPLVATGDVHCARMEDFALLTALHATDRRAALSDVDGYLPAFPQLLRSQTQMAHLHARYPQAVANAGAIGKQCAFDFSLIAPNLPPFPVPAGHDEVSWLRELTTRGATARYGPRDAERIPGAWAMIDHELALITRLGFAGYFLIVHEIVEFCRSRNILCQGRGSAANSAVCFALGITAVDAVQHRLLFERFLSPGRSGPPDIDVDIEAGRREEVIQFVYRRYGRRHAALVANVITYRSRLAVRDAARALGYPTGAIDAMSKSIERGFSPTQQHPDIPAEVARLATKMANLPRHLGIHPGGMVLCDRPVVDVCPVQWAAMAERSVLQWDKDDCADAGLVKFDLLGLGMLTALRYAFTTLAALGVRYRGEPLALHHLPQEDPQVYQLLCAADTIGVFQVESRAQMQTLPRLRPQCFYDIVIEVALVRPGPIQGGSVNPYLRRRQGKEPVRYPHPLLAPALEKTLGVPLFQEQLMQIAIDAAGFNASEADQLRKAMSAKRSTARMEALRERLFSGMAERGICGQVAEEIFHTLKGFAAFGFPESHSFSFAYLVYASAYLKVHHPEAFYAGLLAAQPMGFYAPQSLVGDARRHGVQVIGACINHAEVLAQVVSTPLPPCCEDDHPGQRGRKRRHSEYDAQAAARVHADDQLAVQRGLAAIRGIGKQVATRICAARKQGRFTSPADLARRAQLSEAQVEALASAGALRGFGARREVMWAARGAAGAAGKTLRVGQIRYQQLPLPGVDEQLAIPQLPSLDAASHAALDVWASGVSSVHPISLLRDELTARQIAPISALATTGDGTRIRIAGLVTHRQRPATARGITFLALEDESGVANIICSPGLWQTYRQVARRASALIVRGTLQRGDGALALRADRLDALELPVASSSRDFR